MNTLKKGMLLLVFAMTSPAWSHEAVDQLIAGWQSESSKERAAASDQFLAVLPLEYKTVCQLLMKRIRSGDDPEQQARLKLLLKELYAHRVLGVGVSETGLTLGWFIDYDGKLPSTLPLVIEIAKGSPAEEARFSRGDVIISMNGKKLMSPNSRNDLVQQLARVPVGTTLKFKVKNGTEGRDIPYDIYHKIWEGERSLVTTAKKKAAREKINPEAYRDWLSELEE